MIRLLDEDAFMECVRHDEASQGSRMEQNILKRSTLYRFIINISRYSPLRRLSSSSCGGLRSMAKVILALKEGFFYAVFPFFCRSVVTSVTFSRNHSNFEKPKNLKKSKNKSTKVKKYKLSHKIQDSMKKPQKSLIFQNN